MLKILSLNIEHDRHLPRIFDFLKRQDFDALLLQEVLLDDFELIEKTLGMHGAFAPLNLMNHDGHVHKLGVATFTKSPMLAQNIEYYRGDRNHLSLIGDKEPEKMARAIISVELQHKSQPYRLINTHFTWSARATPNDMQREDLTRMVELLNQYKDFIFCGDLNTPRGKELFDDLAKRYTDNIPKHVSTTIDKNLHKAGDLNIVVDGFFTAGNHHATEVMVIDGLSDHCGISGTISIRN